jgi:myo-inositol 2-dehydrogenase / D-chiro-inositol 1-dehydrogenase
MINEKLDRRSFLKGWSGTAAVVGAAPYLWVAPRKAAETKNDRLGVAVLGTGGRGSLIGHQAGSRGNMLACCDVDRKRAEGFAARYGAGCQVYSDYRRILDRKDVDVVTIGTPDHWHAKMLVDAMAADKDVYCEKPMTLTVEEGKQICRAAERTRRVVQVGTQQRSEYEGLFLRAVALARGGRLGGKLRATACVGQAKRGGPFPSAEPPANLDWDLWLGQAPAAPYCPQRTHYDFRWWREYSGGQVTHWGIHHVDIAMWAMGLENTGPAEIEGNGDFPAVDNGFNVPTTFRCTMRFTGGATIVLSSEKNALVLEGENGRISVDRRHLTGKPVETLSENERLRLHEQVVQLYRGKQPGSHIGNFFQCVRERSRPISDVFTHHRAITACHLCNIAMQVRRKLKWDPVKEIILGDDEASAMLSRRQRSPYTIEV